MGLAAHGQGARDGRGSGRSLLVPHRRVTQAVEHWGQWIIPAVYILIGLYIFQKAGAFSRAF